MYVCSWTFGTRRLLSGVLHMGLSGRMFHLDVSSGRFGPWRLRARTFLTRFEVSNYFKPTLGCFAPGPYGSGRFPLDVSDMNVLYLDVSDADVSHLDVSHLHISYLDVTDSDVLHLPISHPDVSHPVVSDPDILKIKSLLQNFLKKLYTVYFFSIHFKH